MGDYAALERRRFGGAVCRAQGRGNVTSPFRANNIIALTMGTATPHRVFRGVVKTALWSSLPAIATSSQQHCGNDNGQRNAAPCIARCCRVGVEQPRAEPA